MTKRRYALKAPAASPGGGASWERPAAPPLPRHRGALRGVGLLPPPQSRLQQGTNGVSTSGVTANLMFFDGLFGYSR